MGRGELPGRRRRLGPRVGPDRGEAASPTAKAGGARRRERSPRRVGTAAPSPSPAPKGGREHLAAIRRAEQGWSMDAQHSEGFLRSVANRDREVVPPA